MPDRVQAAISATYLVLCPACTMGLSLVLVRLLVQFSQINRSWKMFSVRAARCSSLGGS